MNTEDKRSALLLGFSHFTVDFVCTYLLSRLSHTVSYSQLLAYAIIYNGLAFAFQLPIGALGDLLGLHRGLAALGCVLVALGAVCPQPLALCILIGLGNACFHVGGGREALKRGGTGAGFVGRFVAPGALGIFLGPRQSMIPGGVLAAVLAALSLCLGFTRRLGAAAEKQDIPPMGLSSGRLAGVLGCMFLTVLLRSYMGTVLRYDFMSSPIPAFLFSVCIFLGKYLGGILSDRLGTLRFSAAAQLTGAVLLVLSVYMPWLALPGILLFNTSMAVTAVTLYRVLPCYGGTMFGLTTFALYLGVLPRLLGWENLFFSPWGLGLLCLLSTALLVGGLKLTEGGPVRGHIVGSVSGPDAAC